MIKINYSRADEVVYAKIVRLARLAKWLGIELNINELINNKMELFSDILQDVCAKLYQIILTKYQELEMSKQICEDAEDVKYIREDLHCSDVRVSSKKYNLSEFFVEAKVRFDSDLQLIPSQVVCANPFASINNFYER